MGARGPPSRICRARARAWSSSRRAVRRGEPSSAQRRCSSRVGGGAFCGASSRTRISGAAALRDRGVTPAGCRKGWRKGKWPGRAWSFSGRREGPRPSRHPCGYAGGVDLRQRRNTFLSRTRTRSRRSSSSPICTALRAAPLRTLSATIHRFSPLAMLSSSRMRPT